MNEELKNIWSMDYINELPSFIKERGFMFSENNLSKDILITGFNPSFRATDDIHCHSFNFQIILNNNKWDNYWSPLKKMICDADNNIDLKDRCAYLDIFYFREKKQAIFKNEILRNKHGVRFAAEQLKLTQHTIENIIKPKVIVVKNKESAAYWGKLANKRIFWMGYQLVFIQNMSYGELYKISGLFDSTERIAPEIKETNLKNSLILFTHHINQYTSARKRAPATLIHTLLENYNSENIIA